VLLHAVQLCRHFLDAHTLDAEHVGVIELQFVLCCFLSCKRDISLSARLFEALLILLCLPLQRCDLTLQSLHHKKLQWETSAATAATLQLVDYKSLWHLPGTIGGWFRMVQNYSRPLRACMLEPFLILLRMPLQWCNFTLQGLHD
jgi:hypothetical protein